MSKESTKETYVQKAKNLLGNEKYKKIIIICGLVGIALIFVSNFFDTKKSEPVAINTETTTATVYKQDIEKSLTSMVSLIDGAGTAKVFVTVDCGTELVYAKDDKLTNDINNASGDENSKKLDSQATYITVKLADGSEQAVTLKEIEPKVRGVLVVCSGGESPIIKERVLEAVTKSLDISSAKVCVTKLSE